MKRIVVTAGLALLVACSGSSPSVDEGDMLRGQVTVTAFRSELVGALMRAVAEDPVEAIEVCNLQAPQIAAEISKGNGVQVGRTSHRLRNPENSPEGWTHRWLRHYLDNPDDRDPHAEYINPTTIGYVEPIYMKPLCLTCHGDSIAPAIAARIDELYPEDDARGFENGEFRGLFWVKLPVNEDEG